MLPYLLMQGTQPPRTVFLPKHASRKRLPQPVKPSDFRMTNYVVDEINAYVVIRDIALAEAEKAGVPMPSVGVVRDRLITGIARGYGELDWAALGLIAAEEAGLCAVPSVTAK